MNSFESFWIVVGEWDEMAVGMHICYSIKSVQLCKHLWISHTIQPNYLKIHTQIPTNSSKGYGKLCNVHMYRFIWFAGAINSDWNWNNNATLNAELWRLSAWCVHCTSFLIYLSVHEHIIGSAHHQLLSMKCTQNIVYNTEI